MGIKKNPLQMFEFLSSDNLTPRCSGNETAYKIRSFSYSPKCESCEAIDLGFTNRLFLGDNHQVMCYLLNQGFSEAFQMIYIDPPFFSNKEYYVSKRIKRKNGDEVRIQQVAYSDIWNNLQNYLQFLYPRLVLIRQLLKKDGTLFVHLDWHVSHYVKILLDHVMGSENFRNEIIWCYTGPNRSKQDFPKKHDVIFRYSKSKKVKFHPVYVPYRSGIHDTRGTAMRYQGKSVDFSEKESRGKQLEDWWVDVWAAERYRSDFSYYATEKPKKLLERLILSSTDKGDLVGDFFAGSGTTLVVAEETGRKWIGADYSLHSVNLSRAKLIHSPQSNATLDSGSREEWFHEYVSVGKNNSFEFSNVDLIEEYLSWEHIVKDGRKNRFQKGENNFEIFNIMKLSEHIQRYLQNTKRKTIPEIIVAYPMNLIKGLDVLKIFPQSLQEQILKRHVFFWEQPFVNLELIGTDELLLRVREYSHPNYFIDSFFAKYDLKENERIDQVLVSRLDTEEKALQPIFYWNRLVQQEPSESSEFLLKPIGRIHRSLVSKSAEYVVEIVDLLGLSSFYFFPQTLSL